MSLFNTQTQYDDAAQAVAEIEKLGERLAQVRDRIGRVIFGQQAVVDQALITLLAGGHALLIWRPGLDTRWRSLEAAEAQLVRAVFEGARLDGLSQCAAEAWGPDEAAGALATWVQQSLQEGWLHG